MLTLFVVDRSAEARAKIVEQINACLQSDLNAAGFLPQVSIKPLSIEELKFHAAPDICLLGDLLVAQAICEVGRARRILPESALLVRLSAPLQDIAVIEQLARLGVDDTIGIDITPADFLRKLVLLARRRRKPRSGKLIALASGKGGVGVTTLTAALGEALAAAGRKCAMIDFDFETQDLSRFLQARPFLNENLQLLFDRSRPVTQESVEQCLVQVWDNESRLTCLPPVGENESLYDPGASYARTLLAVLEVLDALNEYVLVDVGSAKGGLLRTLLRAADALVFVINNDPASLYASVDRLVQLRAWLAPGAELLLVENAPARWGLPQAFLRKEFETAAQLPAGQLFVSIPGCPAGGRWPASGGTLYSRSRSSVNRKLKELRTLLDPEGAASGKGQLMPVLGTLLRRSGIGGSALPNPALTCEALPETRAIAAPSEKDTGLSGLITGASLS